MKMLAVCRGITLTYVLPEKIVATRKNDERLKIRHWRSHWRNCKHGKETSTRFIKLFRTVLNFDTFVLLQYFVDSIRMQTHHPSDNRPKFVVESICSDIFLIQVFRKIFYRKVLYNKKGAWMRSIIDKKTETMIK